MTSTLKTATPWVERYRPKSLDDVSHQNEVVATLKNAVETGRLPHLLFYGPPGTGKTSVALALCRQLWDPSQWRKRVLELNASDERGISVVRDKIKHFASLAVGNANNSNSSTKNNAKKASFFAKKKSETTDDTTGGDDAAVAAMDVDEEEVKKYPNPPFKIIILDEADTVTPDAQAALRRVIEAHSRITRFILICNYVTRIIEPLASRCAKFRFQPLPPSSMKLRLHSIAQTEHCCQQEIDLIDDILEHADGDMRRAVTTLQSVHSLAVGAAANTDDYDLETIINKEVVAEIAGLPPADVVDILWNALSTQKTNFDSMEKAVEEVCSSGYSAQLLLSALLPKVMEDSVLSDLGKAEIAIRMAEAERNMIEGADEYLQLMTVCSLALNAFIDSRHASN